MYLNKQGIVGKVIKNAKILSLVVFKNFQQIRQWRYLVCARDAISCANFLIIALLLRSLCIDPPENLCRGSAHCSEDACLLDFYFFLRKFFREACSIYAIFQEPKFMVFLYVL